MTALLAQGPAAARQPSHPDGATVFAENCAACHGSDGRGGERAPDIATQHETVSLSDSDLSRIVHNGIPGAGMPAFGYLGDDKLSSIVNYLRTLQRVSAEARLPGSASAGETLFYGKAGCSRCHMMNGSGGFMGTDLSAYGRDRSLADIRLAIVDPDKELSRSGQAVSVVTVKGQTFKGLVRSQDNFSVILQTEDAPSTHFPEMTFGSSKRAGIP